MDEASEALTLLRDLQWAGRTADGAACCPSCHAAARTGHAPSCRVAAVLAAGPAARWRHRKRGTTYREVGLATLQTNGSLGDQDRMMVYRSEADGTLGVRALAEFMDGRFDRLPA